MVMNLNDWKSIRAEYEFKTGKPLDVYDDAGCLSCVEWAINVGLAEQEFSRELKGLLKCELRNS